METFTAPGEAEPQAVAIAPTAQTGQVALTWSDPGSSFDATGFQLVQPGSGTARVPSVLGKVRPKLKITKKRTRTSLNVRITGLKRGKLKFKIVAKKLKGPTRVIAKIRQSKRGPS